MCGIAGFLGGIAASPDALARLKRITRSLKHRGPDGEAYWLSGNIGLGHVRLAIIDLVAGKQPMWDTNERNVIVFNGEIYNHNELRRELEAHGCTFRTRSDTEVIIAAVDAWGVELGLQRLRGMFAFALYNTQTGRLLLARDRVGIKPLYWASVPEGFLFASEQKALLASGLVPVRANPVAIHDYLAQGYPITPSTCWESIHLMKPGTWMEVAPEGIRTGQYWEWHPRANRTLTVEAGTELAKNSLRDALQCHLVSDVPVGAFLSGGLDSSLIVALLSEGLAPGIQTFNMGFSDPEYDESDFARQVARHCKTAHHEARMESNEGDPDLYCRILAQYDEPFGDSSCLPTYLICGEIRKRLKVVLSGDGGDEVLGGYTRYSYARWLARLARFRGAGRSLNSIARLSEQLPGRTGYRVQKAWRLAQAPRNEMLFQLNVYFSEEERRALYKPAFSDLALCQGTTSSRFAALIPEDVTDPIQQLITAEMRLRLHADYLRKVDVASSAHGLEVRVPYLDNAMLDLAAVLPVRLKVSSKGETKPLSRRLGRQLLPAAVAAKPKQGFGLPLDRWMGPCMRLFLKELLLDRSAAIASWFEREAIAGVWRAFENEQAGGGLSRYQRYQRVFLLASLELWLRKWKPSIG